MFRTQRWHVSLLVTAWSLVALGCPKARPTKQVDAGGDNATDAGELTDSGAHEANGTCSNGGACRRVEVARVDHVDVLFAVDNSSSMKNEQRSLAEALPQFVENLATGISRLGNRPPLPPVHDLHLGVVSTDLGTPGVESGACRSDGGDNGQLQHTPHGEACQPTYPPFLSYTLGISDPVKAGQDFACLVELGTAGCAFEQTLEAPFKALWPTTYTDANGSVIMNPYQFLATSPAGTHGLGDVSAAQGGNLGFLRSDPVQGLSLIAVVAVTDNDDCSVMSTDHLVPSDKLPAGSPYKPEVDLALRCFQHPDKLYDLKTRYFDGFRLLRPNHPELVVFAALAGVPASLVNSAAVAATDFSAATSRDHFYDAILNDAEMTAAVDPTTDPGSGRGNLKPSCRRTNAAGEPTLAFPPRRIVQLARMFEQNGIVQSLCQDDFTPAMDVIATVIGKQLRTSCLPHKLMRAGSGKVECDVIWELPAAGTAPATTPTTCDALPFLSSPKAGRKTTHTAGGHNCLVAQLAVADASSGAPPPPGSGWFYDNFTSGAALECNAGAIARIDFTADAKPPSGVSIMLDCYPRAELD